MRRHPDRSEVGDQGAPLRTAHGVEVMVRPIFAPVDFGAELTPEPRAAFERAAGLTENSRERELQLATVLP